MPYFFYLLGELVNVCCPKCFELLMSKSLLGGKVTLHHSLSVLSGGPERVWMRLEVSKDYAGHRISRSTDISVSASEGDKHTVHAPI